MTAPGRPEGDHGGAPPEGPAAALSARATGKPQAQPRQRAPLDASRLPDAMNGEALARLWRAGAAAPTLDNAGWRRLIGQAQMAGLLPRLALRLQQLGAWDRLPPRARENLLSALALAERQQLSVAWELGQLSQALRASGQPVLLLKGAAYLAAGLPPAQGRTFADVDLLLPHAALPAAEAALQAAGWLPAERDAYNDRYYRTWMHELPPLVHLRRGTAVDVHHTVTPPTSAFNVDGALLIAAAVPVPGRDDFLMLQPVDMVLHSAVHLFGEGEFDRALRDLLDMLWLVQHFAGRDPGFWPALLTRAAELRLQVPLHHALAQLQRLFGLVPPESVHDAVRAMAPGGLAGWAMPRLLTRAIKPRHPSCAAPGDGLARWLLYVRSHALRMPLRLLVPHLVRKAWMQRFPAEAAGAKDAQGGGGVPPIQRA